MNSTGLIGCKRSRLIAERAKRFIYLSNLPISRLIRRRSGENAQYEARLTPPIEALSSVSLAPRCLLGKSSGRFPSRASPDGWQSRLEKMYMKWAPWV